MKGEKTNQHIPASFSCDLCFSDIREGDKYMAVGLGAPCDLKRLCFDCGQNKMFSKYIIAELINKAVSD